MPSVIAEEEAVMMVMVDQCDCQRMSEIARKLSESGDHQALMEHSRKALSCPCLRDCPDGDFCTIFGASLLSDLRLSSDKVVNTFSKRPDHD